jgi:hypothetical protein
MKRERTEANQRIYGRAGVVGDVLLEAELVEQSGYAPYVSLEATVEATRRYPNLLQLADIEEAPQILSMLKAQGISPSVASWTFAPQGCFGYEQTWHKPKISLTERTDGYTVETDWRREGLWGDWAKHGHGHGPNAVNFSFDVSGYGRVTPAPNAPALFVVAFAAIREIGAFLNTLAEADEARGRDERRPWPAAGREYANSAGLRFSVVGRGEMALETDRTYTELWEARSPYLQERDRLGYEQRRLSDDEVIAVGWIDLTYPGLPSLSLANPDYVMATAVAFASAFDNAAEELVIDE